MHFVSDNCLRVNLRPHKELFSQATGEKIGVEGSIHLDLSRGTAPDWAVAEALKHFKFASRPTPGSTGGVDIPVDQWCVYIDTEQWGAQHNHPRDVIGKADAYLSNSPDFLKIELPVLRPPWPNYNELTVQGARTAEKVAVRNLETALEIGITVSALISYEEATRNNADVVALYLKALGLQQSASEEEPAAVLLEA